MAKISIIYWSGTGNTEAMAYYIEEGAPDDTVAEELKSLGSTLASM